MGAANDSLARRPLADPRLVNVHQAKTHLSQLLQVVKQGQKVVIARSGVPIARLLAWQAPAQPVAAPGACAARSNWRRFAMRPWMGCLRPCRDAAAAERGQPAAALWRHGDRAGSGVLAEPRVENL